MRVIVMTTKPTQLISNADIATVVSAVWWNPNHKPIYKAGNSEQWVQGITSYARPLINSYS